MIRIAKGSEQIENKTIFQENLLFMNEALIDDE